MSTGTTTKTVIHRMDIEVHDDYGVDTDTEDFDWGTNFKMYQGSVEQHDVGADINISANGATLEEALSALDDGIAAIKSALSD